jgi:SAM-dependent methyltransferase
MTEKSAPLPNAAQVDYWNAAAGATWAKYHDQLDRQIAPLGLESMRVLAPAAGERVLDIGCGCGHTTVDLATRVGRAGVAVGIDISVPMLEIARRRALPDAAGRVEFLQIDAQIADLGRGTFDAGYSRFGVMFFADPVAAFGNIRRALKSGGRLGFICWRALAANPWMNEPLEAARPFLPPLAAPDPTAPGPFAFANDGRVRAILSDAGFADIEIRAFDTEIGGGDLDETLQLALRVGPLGAALREHPSLKDCLTDPVGAVLARYVTRRGVMMPASAWVVSARHVDSF